jgi:hypothetical protein
MNTPDKPPEQTIKNAQQQIVNEMFKDGWDAGNRIWEDTTHPLQQAFTILMRAEILLTYKEQVRLLEDRQIDQRTYLIYGC